MSNITETQPNIYSAQKELTVQVNRYELEQLIERAYISGYNLANTDTIATSELAGHAREVAKMRAESFLFRKTPTQTVLGG